MSVIDNIIRTIIESSYKQYVEYFASNTVYYKLHTPDNTYYFRCFGTHTLYLSVKGEPEIFVYKSDDNIIMTLQKAIEIVNRFYPLPYSKNSKLCKLEVLYIKEINDMDGVNNEYQK